MDNFDDELLTFSTAIGGGDASKRAFTPLDDKLRRLSEGLRASDHFETLVRLEIWVRICGRMMDCGDKEGPDRLARGRKPPRLVIDLIIPEYAWRDKSADELRAYVANNLRRAIDLMIEQARQQPSEIKDEAKLQETIDRFIDRFLTEPDPPYVLLANPQHLEVAQALRERINDEKQEGAATDLSDEAALTRLYRRDDSGKCLAYHNAWFDTDDEVIVEHKGLVGSTGETIRHTRDPNLTPVEQVERVLRSAREAGYSDLHDSDESLLVVEYRLEGWGSVEDADKLNSLQDELTEILGWSGLGVCDGGEVGSGTMEANCPVVDFDEAKKVLTEALQGTRFADFTRIYEEEIV